MKSRSITPSIKKNSSKLGENLSKPGSRERPGRMSYWKSPA